MILYHRILISRHIVAVVGEWELRLVMVYIFLELGPNIQLVRQTNWIPRALTKLPSRSNTKQHHGFEPHLFLLFASESHKMLCHYCCIFCTKMPPF
jgi:hypothetical protein